MFKLVYDIGRGYLHGSNNNNKEKKCLTKNELYLSMSSPRSMAQNIRKELSLNFLKLETEIAKILKL